MVRSEVVQESQGSNILDSLLRLSRSAVDGCLRVVSSGTIWTLHLSRGRLVYAADSISPLDRLDRMLRRLGLQASPAIQEQRSQVSHLFANDSRNASSQLMEDPSYQAVCWLLNQQYITPEQSAALIEEWTQPNNPPTLHPSYQAICWLFSEELLSPLQATTLIEAISKEVLESLLMITQATCEFIDQDQLSHYPKFCKMEVESLIEEAQQRLRGWQVLGPQIWSPYQRPYFFSQSSSQSQGQKQLSQELQQKLGAVLKGLSFRHLAALLNKDELQLAQTLHPYIVEGILFLGEPRPPFDRFPRIPSNPAAVIPQAAPQPNSTATAPIGSPISSPSAVVASSPTLRKTYTIACVDDSPAMLNEISRLLNDESITIVTIGDPLKALMQIVRVKPDLVLMDVGMPGIDGYELCRLLRNHSLFKATPVIMVTGHTGIIDRARAKLVGASDYLTKPFTQSGLLKVVFKHLS
ncbi:hypothetical protein DO97_10160 [Neosynechococcus sphagnicola sy1]|uniref:Response regulatory domain-containing protein n=1 Tax=Neosynechococcus sphagnicola sy1 TaxID=1497020 RepID=A0A098TPF3_9CYAN|nr:response regulator [Neosynechococcus sphagnicola]KGF73772.1 hypothetical protein DO97_10160 [Neosynechococcus sphagnicola sy1]